MDGGRGYRAQVPDISGPASGSHHAARLVAFPATGVGGGEDRLVGNGEFAFNVDNTGVQIIIRFNTLKPGLARRLPARERGEAQRLSGMQVEMHGRTLLMASRAPELPEILKWLRPHPNRINLGRIGLGHKGETFARSLITELQQELDSWNGVIPSTFRYWNNVGFVDLTESWDPAAAELQRRIILTQYHMRFNSAATGQPPQESGLVYNRWWRKFHPEMVAWHCVHWSTWDRQQYSDNNMGWEGARWQKMAELGTGGIAPGETRAYLMWQQPHPVYPAKLAYRASPKREMLERWGRVVSATAGYTASFPWWNGTMGHYYLGLPTKRVTENSDPLHTKNLAYEIAYWQWGLDTDDELKRLLGQPVSEKWATVAENLTPTPQVDGMYMPWGALNSS
ncbi:hypothetical protein DL771_003494 [Monosporascus sp. 5C6A]|nr:hypothetical protein DL771_003494 [Monosporascus sp. 5C6A]